MSYPHDYFDKRHPCGAGDDFLLERDLYRAGRAELAKILPVEEIRELDRRFGLDEKYRGAMAANRMKRAERNARDVHKPQHRMRRVENRF